MRLYDSDTVLAALRRLGFVPRHELTGARRPSGSHWVVSKRVTTPEGGVRTLSAPIPLDKRPIKR